ncbi:diadenylate cyclase CdaA [Alistipes sp. OttesenSCG-928-L06]|nr:diadenylate cyclase CdaA [Alistipes sp. OttesenSCG-928-L06]
MKIGPFDILDILLTAFLIYQLYRLVRRTNAMSIFAGILMIYLLWVIVRILNMELLSMILGQIIGVGVIALIIVFQPEIRKFLFLIGERYARRNKFLRKLFFPNTNINKGGWTEELIAACVNMAKTKTGALIVIRRNSEVDEYTEQGVVLDAEISSALLENIFFKNSPLHDGAVVIENERIRAARCILPVSERTNIPSYYGTRHRAALGVSEVTDAMIIVVSEERGQISLVTDGRIVGNVQEDRLRELLNESLGEEKK